MARWTDLATWRGNGANQGPGDMVEHRGLVLHIAVGWYEGTIAWQRNPASRVSSHFVVGRESGELAQMVDTATRAWTQGDGNGRWLSSENEGFLAKDSRNPGGWEKLSAWQIEANARLLAKAHKVYGVPLAVAVHPGQKGLGHHSMDREWLDEQWGHDECPGAAIVAQKPAIVARAKEIAGGEDDMQLNDPVSIPKWMVDKWPDEGLKDGTISVNTALGSGYGHSRSGKDETYRQTPLIKAILAAVVGDDAAEAAAQAAREGVREEFARLGPALVAELGDVPAERIEAALEKVRFVVDEG